MATCVKKEDETNVSQALTCTLCKLELKKPKLLPCQHSFCTECLEQFFGEHEEGRPFCCPTCQKEVEIEDGTVENIPNNFLYDIIKEADGQGIGSAVKCIPCNEGEKVVNASHKCLDCNDTLCQHCSEYHCRLTVTKHHVVVPLKDICQGKFKEEFSKRKVRFCDIHSLRERHVPLTAYCDMCNILVCTECMQEDHKRHDFTKINSVREIKQPLFKDKVSNLKRSQMDQEKRVGNIEKAITNTKQKWSQQEEEVHDTAAELHAMVDKIKDGKLYELKSHYEKELQYLEHILREEKDKQSCLLASVAFCEMFLEKCSDSDFLYHESDVTNRMESNQKGLRSDFKRNMMTIDKREIESIGGILKDVFGQFKIQETYFPRKPRIGKVREIFRNYIGMIGIYGLSYASKEIYLAGQNESDGCIYVLNEEGNLKRIMQFIHGNISFDIHVQHSNVYYSVYAKNLRKVVKIEPEGTSFKSIMLPAKDQDNFGQLGIVVGKDNTTYISSIGANCIYKWNKNNDELSTIISSETGYKFKCPPYLCLTPTMELIVSNCSSSNTSVQVFSKEGVFQWQYDGKENGYPIKNPSGVCCDEEGYIYVVDIGHHRIQVIFDGKLEGIIPIDKQVRDKIAVPLTLTPERDLIYSYDNTIIKISFWE